MTETDPRWKAPVTEHPPEQPTDPAADLSRAITRAVEAAIPSVDFEAAKDACNQAGIGAASASLAEVVANLERHQAELRAAQEVERHAREELTTLEAEVAWEVEGRIVTEGAKRFIVTDEDETEMEMLATGEASPVPTGKKVRRQVTADQAKEFVTHIVAGTESVVAAKATLRKATAEVDAAKDVLVLDDKRFTAARLGVEAAVAILQTLRMGLGVQ